MWISFIDSQNFGHCVLNIFFGDFSNGEIGLDLVLELPKQPRGVALLLRQLQRQDLVHYDENSHGGGEEEAGGQCESEKRCSAGCVGDSGHGGCSEGDHIDGVEKQNVPVITLLADVVVHLNMIGDCFEDHIQFRSDENVCVRLKHY